MSPSPCPYLFPSDSLPQSVSISFSVSAIGDSLFLAIRHSGHRAHAIHVPQARRHARCMLAHTHQRRARKTERLHAKPSDSTRAPCGTHARRPPSGSIAARVHAPRPHGRTSRATVQPHRCPAPGTSAQRAGAIAQRTGSNRSILTGKVGKPCDCLTISVRQRQGRSSRSAEPTCGFRVGGSAQGTKRQHYPRTRVGRRAQPHPFAAMGTLTVARTHAGCIHSRTHARRLHTLKHTRPPAGD